MGENFKKVESKFIFYKKWLDGTGKIVTIELVIDYENKNFKVKPQKSTSTSFTFYNGNSSNSLMWIAVAETIKEATEFAIRELGL
jgi:hypothetical protein